ncbi:MAG: hypothetical protein Q9208_008503 [Pyrenodesmia sp. 3 TL-2023]
MTPSEPIIQLDPKTVSSNVIAGPALALVSLILIAGAALLIFLTLLGGAIDKNPTDQFYFLEADTSGLGDAAERTSGNKYYLETRFMFAFVIIGLFFAVCALFLGLVALCSRIGSFLSSAMCSVALFFQTITAALMTAAYVQGRNAFRSQDRTATLGRYNFGFMWAAVAALFLATLLFCVGGITGKKDNSYSSRTGGRRFFGRKKSTRSARSRGSFIDPERQRRMDKEDSD